jgi:hypothetical protein
MPRFEIEGDLLVCCFDFENKTLNQVSFEVSDFIFGSSIQTKLNKCFILKEFQMLEKLQPY